MKGTRLARIEEIPKSAFLKCFETGAGGDNKNPSKKS